jgi:hypothetical protein
MNLAIFYIIHGLKWNQSQFKSFPDCNKDGAQAFGQIMNSKGYHL